MEYPVKMLIGTALIFMLASSARAASFHWVDREGFHSVDQVTKVPLEHRKDLPMARNGTSFPFTGEEDRDGAMFVWFILGLSGLDYSRIKAADFPKSPIFTKVLEPQVADIAWWKGFVAIFKGKDGILLTAQGEMPLKAMEKRRGPVTWYRYSGPPPMQEAPTVKRAPKTALTTADKALAGLDGAETFPLRIKDEAGKDILQEKWRKAAAVMEAVRKKYPDDPQVLRRLGVCYRMGHNLDMPGAWDRAEAYLLRTEELAPDEPDAYISLGILYADTGIEYAEQAERQFRTALRSARQDQLPQIWWGLAVALYYQGKVTEAVETIERLIARHPEDAHARKLRETMLKGEGGKQR